MNATIERDSSYAPCSYLIVPEDASMYDDEKTILVQTDWDFPGLARNTGWNMIDVQPKPGYCNGEEDSCNQPDCEECRRAIERAANPCNHDSTDGTVTCRQCGLTAGDFITAASDWLDEHTGELFDASDYFPEQEK